MTDTIARYQGLIDSRLTELLGSFSEYDFEYKPLFSQNEFERQLYPLIEPLMNRPARERYSSIFQLFKNVFHETVNPSSNPKSKVTNGSKLQHNKFITLIDISVLISKMDSSNFGTFPNEIVHELVGYDLFDDFDDLLSEYGRMNYKFNMRSLKSKRKEYIRSHPGTNDSNQSKNKIKKKKKKNYKTTAMLLDELTEKLLNKQSANSQLSKKNSKDSKADHKHNESSLPLEEGKHACCRPEYKVDTSSDESNDDNGDDDDDVDDDDDESDEYEDAKESFIETKASFRNIKVKPEAPSKQQVHEDKDTDVSDAASADDLSDESEDEQGLINRTTLRLHRNKTIDKRSNRNTHFKDAKVINSNDELIPSAIATKEKTAKKKVLKGKREKLKLSKKPSSALVTSISSSKNGASTSKKRRSSNTIQKPELKKATVVPKNRFKNNWSVVIEPNLNFLYTKLESQFKKVEPNMVKIESRGFIYKPSQYSLFEELNENENFSKGEFRSLDNLINSFLLQTFKRAGGCPYDSTMFLHPLEYSYIQENLIKIKESSSIKLPPLLFGNRWQSLIDLNNNLDLKGSEKLNIKATKVKDIWILKPFANEDHYWDHFKKIVPRDKVAKRLEFLNSIIFDSENNLYVCDDLQRIQELVANNPELLNVCEHEDEDEANNIKANSRSMSINNIINNDDIINDEIKAASPSANASSRDHPKSSLQEQTAKEYDDNRNVITTTLRGVWVSCKSIKKILKPQEHFKVISNILFPGLIPRKEYSGVVSEQAIERICEIYSGFRPYLLSLFIDDIIEFTAMPMYFKLDSTMFELQAQELFKRKTRKQISI